MEFTSTASASRCEHKNGWYGYVNFWIFRRRIFMCDCGKLLYGKELKKHIGGGK